MFRQGKRGVYGLIAAAALALGAITQVHATPLDKLIGKSLAVGNLMFSNIQAPSFSGVGPSAIDVQGVVVVDPVTGAQRTGLRFVAPLSQSPSGGPHEIVMNVLYTVTDLTGRLATIEQTLNATAFGQANVFYFTQASPSPGFVANNQLTVLDTCAIPAPGAIACGPSSGPLFPGFASYFVEHQVQMIIANRKGGFGTTSLQEFEILYGE